MLFKGSTKRPRRNRAVKKGEVIGRDQSQGKRSTFRVWVIGLMVFLIGGTAFYGGRQLVTWVLKWTEVQHVSVVGLNRLTREEVLAKINIPQGASLLSLSTPELAERVQDHPWVEEVEVNRVFPASLVVNVTERKPAALLRTSGETVLLDAGGHVLPGKLPSDAKTLPVVEGLTLQSVADHGRGGHPRAKQGVLIARLLAPYFSGRLQVNVSKPQATVVDLPQVRFQFGKNVEEQWQRFLVLYPTIKPEIEGRSQEVDLRFSQKVILRKRTL